MQMIPTTLYTSHVNANHQTSTSLLEKGLETAKNWFDANYLKQRKHLLLRFRK